MAYPERRTQFADTKTYKVKAALTVRAGFPVVLSSAAVTDPNYQEVLEATADTDVVLGIALGKHGTTFTAGQFVEVNHVFQVVEHVLVGTGGATAGARATLAAAANGLTNAPAHGTGARIHSPGIFLLTGVAGDFVPLGVAPAALSKA